MCMVLFNSIPSMIVEFRYGKYIHDDESGPSDVTEAHKVTDGWNEHVVKKKPHET